MALVGIYRIKESGQLFDCLDENIRNLVKSRGEYSITDAIECMIGSWSENAAIQGAELV